MLISENVDFLSIQSCGKIYSPSQELGLGLQLDLPKESTGNNSLHSLSVVSSPGNSKAISESKLHEQDHPRSVHLYGPNN